MADQTGGLTGWFVKWLRAGKSARPRLELLERITIGPRQTVALIEAEGQRLLVACGAEGEPTIYPLGPNVNAKAKYTSRSAEGQSRISW